MKGLSGKRFADTLTALLKQGITAEWLALSMAVGLTVGSFPLVGTTTILCAGIALIFRLNFAAVQIGNWAAYPLQIVLLAPFMIAGNYLFGPYGNPPGQDMIFTGHLSFPSGIKMLSGAAFHGIFVWTLLAPVFILVFYSFFLLIFRRWKKAWEA